VLRVVFHPDRYQDPRQKDSRQRYLQAVDEAVQFMLSDAFSYEIAADSVPSHKNPMVSLREAVNVRDTIIKRQDERISTLAGQTSGQEKDINEARTNAARAMREMQRRETSFYNLHRITSKLIRKHPTPIGATAYVTGAFIEFRAESALAESMAHYATLGEINESHDWIVRRDWLQTAKTDDLTSAAARHRFGDGAFTHSTYGRCKIKGAMSMAHLCNWIRVAGGFPQTMTPAEAIATIKPLSAPVPAGEAGMNLDIEIGKHSLPFYAENMLLILECRKKDHPDALRLFAVSKVETQEKHVRAELALMRRKFQAMQKKTHAADLNRRAKLVAKLEAVEKLKTSLKDARKKAPGK